MFRKDLVELLRGSPRRLSELAKLFDVPPREIEEDLKHLSKSLRHTKFALIVAPAKCRKCGFVFGKDRFTKPGKCPLCHATWLNEPLLQIRKKDKKGS
jgi:transcriptional regulator